MLTFPWPDREDRWDSERAVGDEEPRDDLNRIEKMQTSGALCSGGLFSFIWRCVIILLLTFSTEAREPEAEETNDSCGLL